MHAVECLVTMVSVSPVEVLSLLAPVVRLEVLLGDHLRVVQHRVDRGAPRPEGVADPLHDLRRLLVKTVPQPAQIFFKGNLKIQYTTYSTA